jgi:hypothetical protein
MPKISFAARCLRDDAGATISEFAIVAPIFLTLLMGTFDVTHTMYVRSVLQGEVYKAARDSALKAGGRAIVQQEIDERLRGQIMKLLPNDAVINGPTRANFSDYQDSGEFGLAEPYTDTNSDGECNNGEVYEDRNGNSSYDNRSGDYVGTEKDQGGARDVVRYSVKVTYDGFFPLPSTLGERTIEAESVIVNQPFDDQAEAVTGTCDS